MSPELAGKVAIITGGASGIGLATAQTFLSAGVAGLTLVDLSSDNLALALASFSPEDQRRVLTVTADVSDETAVESCITQTVDRFGKLDISCQNAGMSQDPIRIQDMDVNLFMKLQEVNVKGPFLGIKHSVRAMLASSHGGKGCSIVLTGSQLGFDGAPLMSAYSTSKFAVRGLGLSVAAELGLSGIRVNTVCPGPIITPMLACLPEDQWPKFAEKAMLGRLGQAQEIANAVLFLASDASSYVTGSSMKVDGGWSRFG